MFEEISVMQLEIFYYLAMLLCGYVIDSPAIECNDNVTQHLVLQGTVHRRYNMLFFYIRQHGCIIASGLK